jgi:hypothetical protein
LRCRVSEVDAQTQINRYAVKGEVSVEDYQKMYAANLKEQAARANFPGFRSVTGRSTCRSVGG